MLSDCLSQWAVNKKKKKIYQIKKGEDQIKAPISKYAVQSC